MSPFVITHFDPYFVPIGFSNIGFVYTIKVHCSELLDSPCDFFGFVELMTDTNLLRNLALLIFFICYAGQPSTLYAQTFSLTDLGDLQGGIDFGYAYGVNDVGQVVGFSRSHIDDTAFFWDAAIGMQNLGFLPGGDAFSEGQSVNLIGQVVGTSDTVSGAHAFMWDSVDGMQDLGLLPGSNNSSFAYDINNLGQVVGYGNSSTGEDRAFLWTSGTGMQEIEGLLPNDSGRSYANAINNVGQVVGDVFSSEGHIAFLWDPKDGVSSLGNLANGTGSTEANEINDVGQIVGKARTDIGSRAFLWDAIGGMQDLGDLAGGSDYSQANGINNNGWVVGRSESAAGRHAFLWTAENGMQDLNDLLAGGGSEWTIVEAFDINASGQIAAYGVNSSGVRRSLLLTPSSVPVAELNIVHGSQAAGSLEDTLASDDEHLVLDPEFLTSRYQLEFTVSATSPTESPSALEFGYESRAFSFVGTVDQEIELFNFDSGQFETVDSRLASATDSIVSVTPGGDPARFVKAGTNAIRARISYQNSLPFWVFSTQNLYLPYRVRADHIFWTITP